MIKKAWRPRNRWDTPPSLIARVNRGQKIAVQFAGSAQAASKKRRLYLQNTLRVKQNNVTFRLKAPIRSPQCGSGGSGRVGVRVGGGRLRCILCQLIVTVSIASGSFRIQRWQFELADAIRD